MNAISFIYRSVISFKWAWRKDICFRRFASKSASSNLTTAMSMSSPILITQTLVSLVERATCIQELTPLLNSMFRLTEMKDIVKQRLSAMNISQKRDLHLKVSPMDELLPHHIIQYMVGFNEDHRNVALVNKTFHKCSQSAQRLLLRQQQTDWQREFNDLHSDFGNNRITHVYS
eukprot:470381_1